MTMSATSNEDEAISPAPPEPSLEARVKRRSQFLEIITAVLLSIATLATSWSGYQASRWGGVQSTLYSKASALRVESTRAYNRGGQQRLADVVLFGNWLNAYSENNMELAELYVERFRPEFVPAFEAWIASDPFENPDALPSPFAQPEYVVALEQQAQQQDEEASATFVKGQDANQQSDDYVFNAVLLASVLFFGGISQRFLSMRISAVMLGIAAILCIIGLFNIASYPVL